MNEQERKLDIIQQYFSYCNILDQKGISYSPRDLGDLQAMSLVDLQGLLRQVRDIARTPVT